MATRITELQKKAAEEGSKNIDWSMLEELWFDWLEEQIKILKPEEPEDESTV